MNMENEKSDVVQDPLHGFDNLESASKIIIGVGSDLEDSDVEVIEFENQDPLISADRLQSNDVDVLEKIDSQYQDILASSDDSEAEELIEEIQSTDIGGDEKSDHSEPEELNSLNDFGVDASELSFLDKFRVNNTRIRQYYCKYCNTFFKGVVDFNKHFQSVHFMEMADSPLLCPVRECEFKATIHQRLELLKHIASEHLKNTKSCIYCRVLFQRSDLTAHIKDCREKLKKKKQETLNVLKDDDDEINQIEMSLLEQPCGISESNISGLEHFVMRNTAKAQFYCKFCNNFQRERHTFEKHNQSVHSITTTPKEPLFCPVDTCKAKFKYINKSELTKHVRVEHLRYTIKCSHCDEVFGTVEHKNAHINVCVHVPIETRTVVESPLKGNNGCFETNEKFLMYFMLKNRYKYYHFCKKCNKFEISAELFIVHLRNIHKTYELPEKPLECPVRYCTETFKIDDKNSLQEHVRSIHLGCFFFCKFCNESFRLQKEKQHHELNSCSERNKAAGYTGPIKCGYCDKSFGSEARKTVHINRVHLNKSRRDEDETLPKIIHVDVSRLLNSKNESTNSYQNKKVHYEINKEFLTKFLHEKKFKSSYFCKTCNKFVRTPRLFQMHINKKHKTEVPDKPLQCPVVICNKIFKIDEKFILQQHVAQQHLGYKFKCNFCCEFFSLKNDRVNHIKKQCPMKKRKPKKHRILTATENSRYQQSVILMFKEILKSQSLIDNLFPCKLCDGKKIRLYYIGHHFNTIHNKERTKKPILCPVEDCTMCFDFCNRFDLIEHMKLNHQPAGLANGHQSNAILMHSTSTIKTETPIELPHAEELYSTDATLSADENETCLQNIEEFIEEEYSDFAVDSSRQLMSESIIIKEEEELDIIDDNQDILHDIQEMSSDLEIM